METGIFLGHQGSFDGTLSGLMDSAVDAENRGFEHVWLGDSFGLDALSTLALAGTRTRRIRLATAVLPIQTRHPVAMAREATTLNQACGHRFDLGLGISHQFVVEQMLGCSYKHPVRQMREYVQIVQQLLEGHPVSYLGDFYRINQVALTDMAVTSIRISIAALRPKMLELAADLQLGTITFMTGPATLARRIVNAGVPRVAAMFPVLLTDDVERGRAHIDQALRIYGMTPAYRAMLDEEHQNGPGDNAIVGGEKELADSISRLDDIGVSDFIAAIVAPDEPSYARTLEFLAASLPAH